MILKYADYVQIVEASLSDLVLTGRLTKLGIVLAVEGLVLANTEASPMIVRNSQIWKPSPRHPVTGQNLPDWLEMIASVDAKKYQSLVSHQNPTKTERGLYGGKLRDFVALLS